MQKQKENLFFEKFRLLNSQEHNEEINWSCSDSSEYENVSNVERFCNQVNKAPKRKRKLKKKAYKNISNLDVTIIDASKDVKEEPNENDSPILAKKQDKSKAKKSPLPAAPSKFLLPINSIKTEPTSPILTCKVSQREPSRKLPEKSPILVLKHISQKASPKVRKKLFKNHQTALESRGHSDNNFTEIITVKSSLDKRKNCDILSPTNAGIIPSNNQIKSETDLQSIKLSLEKLLQENVNNTEVPIKIEEVPQKTSSLELVPKEEISEIKTEPNSDDSFVMLTSNSDLAKRVKSYFDSHFSSETASQHSIDSLTPKQNSKTSDEIEIQSFVTQVNSNRTSINSEQDITSKNPSPISSQSAELGERTKKIRYKKNSLAYRLNVLLKKQNAHISLWQHERFLAENSNFLIPKGEYMIFRIKKINYKYGAYILESSGANDCNYIILIQSIYVQNTNICEDAVLKLYEPLKIVDYSDDCKLIINVCKLETVTFN